MSNAKDKIDWPRLSAYFEGKCSPEESAEVEQWIASDPEHRSVADKLELLWESRKNPAPITGDREVIKSRIMRAALSAPASAPKTLQNGILHRATARWASYAAAAIVIGVLSWQVMPGVLHNDKPVTKEYTTYTTRPGQRISLRLSDGSHVTLGPATTLRVQKTAKANEAVSVDVTGEALFQVAHAATRSFTVTAHGITTKVLGTEFVVRAYDASNVRVAVRDGRVSVQNPLFTSATSAIINAGEAASAPSNAQPVVTPISDLATDFAWANGELVLRNVPVGEAFVRLSRWYGVEFKVADTSLLDSRVDAVFPSGFSRVKMDVLARAIGARAQYAAGSITFSEE